MDHLTEMLLDSEDERHQRLAREVMERGIGFAILDDLWGQACECWDIGGEMCVCDGGMLDRFVDLIDAHLVPFRRAEDEIAASRWFHAPGHGNADARRTLLED